MAAIVLAANFHDPVFVALRRHGDGIIGMEQQIAPVVRRQELVHFLLRWDLDQRLRVRQKRTVTTDRAGQEHTPVFRHAISDQGRVQRLLRVVNPNQLPAQVAHRQRVVMFHAEGARIIQRPVSNHGDHRNAQRGSYGQRFHGIHPADAAGAAEHASSAGGGVLHDFKLRVLAFSDDILAVHLAVRHQLANVLHDGVVGTDGIGCDYVNVRQLASHRNGFAAGD